VHLVPPPCMWRLIYKAACATTALPSTLRVANVSHVQILPPSNQTAASVQQLLLSCAWQTIAAWLVHLVQVPLLIMMGAFASALFLLGLASLPGPALPVQGTPLLVYETVNPPANVQLLRYLTVLTLDV